MRPDGAARFRRRPPPGLIVHTDRGSQYCSEEFRQALSSAIDRQALIEADRATMAAMRREARQAAPLRSLLTVLAAVLFGVPGGAASAATVLDGFPMAKRGEAGRALSAAYMSSLMGGIFGAALLAVSIPILRPLMDTMVQN